MGITWEEGVLKPIEFGARAACRTDRSRAEPNLGDVVSWLSLERCTSVLCYWPNKSLEREITIYWQREKCFLRLFYWAPYFWFSPPSSPFPQRWGPPRKALPGKPFRGGGSSDFVPIWASFSMTLEMVCETAPRLACDAQPQRRTLGDKSSRILRRTLRASR